MKGSPPSIDIIEIKPNVEGFILHVHVHSFHRAADKTYLRGKWL